MKWMQDHIRTPKDPEYAKRVLDRYRLGMRAKGAIRGVRIVAGADSCPNCQAFTGIVYHPDEAPLLPITECSHPGGCRCAYAPVMTYD